MELIHQPGDIIQQRYRILEILGQGGVGITYAAEDLESGDGFSARRYANAGSQSDHRVALKALSFRRMSDWKKIELFEREAKILSQLYHLAIPRYLDYFQVDTGSDRFFYIAQQLAPGKSLATLIENGWKPQEKQVRHIAIQVLEILIYLQSLKPPVIHRDIKPQNIILNFSPTAKDQGDIFLVDFGAVQDTYHNTVTGGSTVVGTYGYMAPEQFRGQAVLATDLYGLGTTLLFLLTGKSPADLPQRHLKIDFRPHVRISPDFANWLDIILEPVSDDRFLSANLALAVLRGEKQIPDVISHLSLTRSQRPKNSSIIFHKTEAELTIEIPPEQLRHYTSWLIPIILLLGNGLFLLTFWVLIFEYLSVFNLFGFLFICLFFYIYLFLLLPRIADYVLSPISKTRIKINQNGFYLKRWLLVWSFQNCHEYVLDIKDIIAKPMQPITVSVFNQTLRKYRFASLLSTSEKKWIVWEIRAFLDKLS
ncbi:MULTISPECIES: serine/threonine protein kinase [unclassified Tolypothrix]|uniref:serine/threonine protein kinase n=1 Tax=unclassified Tolypothrix TaxID=2649714 RepID=UPI0005EAAE77|nr:MULTISPECIES: serine/threonine-protein kinase [unclassified Tolypothrix]BAY88981.1 serine/threonine protein kinase [Microchaete diplosiphon NIES-3275]EKF06124.1 kinase domain protein [Tolypothrix sp. PCC 7601]MBE9080750.1 serine/threonine protein kinase [Tolypothrix sp. LEGE 11397]UYD29616.1 serine/threonine protein kinase [Tolypothrix sp. PCC 7712]UYD34469.1 serine/threonine protein kinase [Tolypothrix sp. PCC 7601]